MTDRYWSSFVNELAPYVPGEQPVERGLIKLNTNENPYGPSPAVLAAIKAAASSELRLYPPPGSDALKQAVADYYGLSADQVFVGNGSDEVLAHTFNALLRHSRPVLFADITYSFYPVYCGLYGIEYHTIPLDSALRLDIEPYFCANGGVVVANPNAPTGRFLELSEIERLLIANRDSVVVVDEAYIDFGGESAISLIDDYDNLLVVQTLSKSRSLAGLRVGFALGHPHLVEALNRVKNSFNSYPVSQLAVAGGVAALQDEDYFQYTRQAVMETREFLTTELETRGFDVIPSAANFVFARHERFEGAALTAALRREKMVVRHFQRPRISEYLRITVGTQEQMGQFIDALDRLPA